MRREFRHDDADVLGAFRHLDAHQFFDRQCIAEVVGHGIEVVQPVGVGHVLQEGVALADLLVVAVQVAHDRLQADDGLAVEHHHRAENAVGGGVLRTHVDEDVVGLDAVPVLGGVLLQGAIERLLGIGEGDLLRVKTRREVDIIAGRGSSPPPG